MSAPASDTVEQGVDELMAALGKPPMKPRLHPALLVAIGIAVGVVASFVILQPSRFVVINSSPQVIKLDHWTGRTYTLAPFPGAQWQEVRTR